MKLRTTGLALLLLTLSSGALAGDECWIAGNFVGKSASSFENYEFVDNSFADGMLICFTGDTGTVTGSDLSLLRMGPSTLIGWGTNDKGLEVVNTYQIDRVNKMLLITQSRIGTATMLSTLPDFAAAFVGNVKQVD